MSERILKQIILDTVLPGASILEDGPHFLSTTTHIIGEDEFEQIEKLRETGIRFTISAWPAGVIKPNLDDKPMQGRLVIRFEWEFVV